MSRIYKVTIKAEGEDAAEKLVRANSRGAAIRFVAETMISAQTASQEDVLQLAAQGVEDATGAAVEEPEQAADQTTSEKAPAKREKAWA